MFEQGYSTKNSSGIGLSACKEIIKRYGGCIDFDPDTDDEGIVLRIELNPV